MSVARLRLVVDAPAVGRHACRAARGGPTPTLAQQCWLRRGLNQPGGKLPLFDEFGQRFHPRTIQRCVDAGWAEPWFANPIHPNWQVCKLTDSGRKQVRRQAVELRLVT